MKSFFNIKVKRDKTAYFALVKLMIVLLYSGGS